MNKTLSLTISMILIGTAGLQSAQAKDVDCVNHWVNPESKMVQCFDAGLNYMAVPLHNLYTTPTITNSPYFEDSLRRRSTTVEMIMPNLIGKEIDLAEDYLLDMGVTLGSESVYAQNKTVGEITQQSPAAGTKLVKGETVLLQYMGATINPAQIK